MEKTITIETEKKYDMRGRSHRYPRRGEKYIDTIRYDNKLKEYDLGYQLFLNIPDKYLSNFSNLKILYIDGNKLTNLPSPDLMPNITKITASINCLTEIPYYSSLKFLDISKNKILNIDNYNNSDLEYLDVSYNKNINIDISLPKCTKLFINDICLEKLNFDNYPKIEILDCENNNLEKIETNKICNLLEINLNNNKLTNIPDFPQIQYLSINNNMLIEICNYPQLTNLNIENNNIKKISNIPKLKYLCAKNNSLEEIDFFPDINIFDASYNNIKNMDIPVYTKILKLQFNPLQQINFIGTYDTLNNIEMDHEFYKHYCKNYNCDNKIIYVDGNRLDKILLKMKSEYSKKINYIRNIILRTPFDTRKEYISKSLKIKYNTENEKFINNIISLYEKVIVVKIYYN